MRITKLILNNFGLYRGENIIDFFGVSEDRPVVLIGGLNGRGKTTMLNALYIALFGADAPSFGKSQSKYLDEIQRLIHRAPDVNSASITLCFTSWTTDGEIAIEVQRSWSRNGEKLEEKLMVKRDGNHDLYMSNSWSEVVEEFFPKEISELFLFDGEKLEAYANPSTSRKLLRSAVGTLLGLDYVERLQKDLVVLEKTKRKEIASDAETRILTEIEERVRKATDEAEKARLKIEQQREMIDSLRARYVEIDDDYRRKGGELYESRSEIEAESKAIKAELERIDDQLRVHAEGSAPLLMVRTQLNDLVLQVTSEHEAARNQVVVEVMRDRDRKILEIVEAQDADESLLRQLNEFLQEDLEGRIKSGDETGVLSFSEESLGGLKELADRELASVENEIQELLADRQVWEARLVDINRKLTSIPEDAFIADLLRERSEVIAARDKEEADCIKLEEDLRVATYHLEAAESAYQKTLKDVALERFGKEEAERIANYAGIARATMKEFASRVAAHHTSRISALVCDSFVRLLDKEGLIKDLVIDPESFDISIEGGDGKIIHPESLSAGERQLLAVAILWGLARASGYPLPVIVDTPLGRLDGPHRRNLVGTYFPSASHQVILLSTDSEIRGELLEELDPFIASSYLLEYQESQRCTAIREGYFQ